MREKHRRSAASAVLFSFAMKMKNAENSDYERILSQKGQKRQKILRIFGESLKSRNDLRLFLAY